MTASLLAVVLFLVIVTLVIFLFVLKKYLRKYTYESGKFVIRKSYLDERSREFEHIQNHGKPLDPPSDADSRVTPVRYTVTSPQEASTPGWKADSHRSSRYKTAKRSEDQCVFPAASSSDRSDQGHQTGKQVFNFAALDIQTTFNANQLHFSPNHQQPVDEVGEGAPTEGGVLSIASRFGIDLLNPCKNSNDGSETNNQNDDNQNNNNNNSYVDDQVYVKPHIVNYF